MFSLRPYASTSPRGVSRLLWVRSSRSGRGAWTRATRRAAASLAGSRSGTGLDSGATTSAVGVAGAGSGAATRRWADAPGSSEVGDTLRGNRVEAQVATRGD